MLNKIEKMSRVYNMKKYSYDLNKIAAIDPFDFHNVFILEDDIIRKKSIKEKISKNTLISSYIPMKYITNYEMTIPKNLINKIDVADHIEIQAYEELELDEAEKYIFKYKLDSSIADEKNMIAQVVIVQENVIKRYFESITNNYDYIDYLGHSGFLFESLYQTNILKPKKDIFIYFTKDFSLISLYADGTFLQTILLNQGIENLYEKLKQDSEINITNFNYEIFVDLLTKKGLNIDYYDYSEEILFNELSKIFSKLFIMITNQFNSLQRKFALATIDRVFISTENGTIPRIIDFVGNYLGEVEVNELKFDSKYNPNNVQIDQLSFLSILSTQYAYKEDYQLYNFTIKKRPPTFFYRKSGQFISISVVSLILCSLYPTTQYLYSLIKSHENQKLEVKLNNLTSNFNSLNNTYNHLSKAYKNEKKIVSDKKRYIESVDKIITILYKEKNGYIPLSSLIVRVSVYMKKNKIYAKNIDFRKDTLKLNIFSKKESYITSFINDLVEKEHLKVETNGVRKDKNSQNYMSTIDVIKVDL